MAFVMFKILVFVAALVALLMFATRFSSSAPQDPTDPNAFRPDADGDDERAARPATGADLGLSDEEFARQFAEIPRDERPDLINYYFDEIDLVAGPADKYDFLDRLSLVFKNSNGLMYTETLVVTTPKALARVLDEEHRTAIYAARYLIVPRFDAKAIVDGYLRREGTSADKSDPEQEGDPIEETNA